MPIITFTGVDHTVGAQWIKDMGRKFITPSGHNAIEFAILRSPKVGQSPRYPTMDVIRGITSYVYPHQLAFHLCGRYAQMVHDREWLELCSIVDFSLVSRVQVNSTLGDEKAMITIMQFAKHIGKEVIMQWRQDTFPFAGDISLLQDRSGGTGQLAEKWATPDNLCIKRNDLNHSRTKIGYAGGLGPHNIEEQLPKIILASRKHGFWIDCETGIRTNDLFDKQKAEEMATIVFEQLGWKIKE